MKNRNLNHKDDWKTPDYFYKTLEVNFDFDFDPCPFHHDMSFDGLTVDWGDCNFVNPPYSRKLKEAFIKKAIEESKKGKTCVCLIPVSTSTKLFHEYILPNKKQIFFIKKRIKFIGVNSKGEYVNWKYCKEDPPKGVKEVSNSGMHDSMLVIF
jgi:hypothetical protein